GRVSGAEARGEEDIGADELPRSQPRVVEPRELAAGPLLKQLVSLGAPREEVASPPLDLAPDGCPVEGVEERMAGEAVGLLEAGGGGPSQVEQGAARSEEGPPGGRGRAHG